MDKGAKEEVGEARTWDIGTDDSGRVQRATCPMTGPTLHLHWQLLGPIEVVYRSPHPARHQTLLPPTPPTLQESREFVEAPTSGVKPLLMHAKVPFAKHPRAIVDPARFQKLGQKCQVA